jgi:hypothetical protein
MELTLGDRAAAVALLEEAEQLLGDRTDGAWALANAWRKLGDTGGEARVLDGAAARATRSYDALTIAKAWASHENPSGVDRALARARELAHTARDWLDVAEVAHDTGRGETAVRAALERAVELAADDDTRANIARAFYRWLGDQQAADRVGARGVRPEALRGPVKRLDGWPASASALFDWLRERAGPKTLASIAEADYGIDFDKHLAALEDMCATGLVPRSMGWHPGEVVQLTRWREGENVDHLARALACVLVMMSDDDATDSTIPVLVDSCIVLGPEARELGERFFAWRCATDAPRAAYLPPRAETEDDEDEGAEDEGAEVLSLAAVLLLRAAGDPAHPGVAQAVDAFLDHPWCVPDDLRRGIGQGLRTKAWARLIDRILVARRADHAAIDRFLTWFGVT